MIRSLNLSATVSGSGCSIGHLVFRTTPTEITPLSPSHSILSSNCGERSTGSLWRRFGSGISKASVRLESSSSNRRRRTTDERTVFRFEREINGRDWRFQARERLDEKPAITCGLSICEPLGTSGWWNSSGRNRERHMECETQDKREALSVHARRDLHLTVFCGCLGGARLTRRQTPRTRSGSPRPSG